MNMFKRTKSIEPKQLPEHKGRFPEALIREFNDSAFGKSCCTLTFQNSMETGKLVRQKAVRMPGAPANKRWSVFQITIDPNSPLGKSSVKQKDISNNISFFEAIEKLALFENNPFPGMKAEAKGMTADEHGDDYFKTLAKKEGIAFDLKGAPHPTLNGEIITSGQFATESLEEVRQTVKKIQRPHKLQIDKAFVGQILDKTDKKISFEAISALHNDKDIMGPMASLLRIQAAWTQLMIEADFDWDNFDRERFKNLTGQSIEQSSTETYWTDDSVKACVISFSPFGLRFRENTRKRFPSKALTEKLFKELAVDMDYELLQKVKNKVSGLHKDETLERQLKQTAHEIRFFHLFALAKKAALALKEVSGDGPKESNREIGILERHIGHTKEYFEKSGGSEEEFEQLETSIMNAEPFNPSIVPWDKYYQMADDLDLMVKQSEKLIKREWEGHKTVVAPVSEVPPTPIEPPPPERSRFSQFFRPASPF